MTQFEQEVRTSLNTIQTQLASTQSQADRTNASIARIGPSMRTAAVEANVLEKNLGKITMAAGKAGGPIAGMVAGLGGLAAFNPLALAAGAAIGGITTAVYGLVQALMAANAEQAKFGVALGAGPGLAAEAGKAALRGADVNALRYGVDTSTMERNLADFTKGAPGAKLSDQQRLQAQLGMVDMDPAAFTTWLHTQMSRPGWQQADAAEALRASETARSTRAASLAMAYAAGSPMSQSDRASLAMQTNPELSAAINKLSDEIRDMGKQRGGFQIAGSEERLEAAIRQKSADLSAMLDQAAATIQ